MGKGKKDKGSLDRSHKFWDTQPVPHKGEAAGGTLDM
jgi:hypothetical protein